MSLADEMLNGLEKSYISRLTNSEVEPHIIIGDDRFITVPDELKRIAVQYDHNIETVTFDCPRYWDGLDMSTMKIYVNYLTKNHTKGMYLVDNVRVDEEDASIMHFEWTISRNVTETKGMISFLVCVRKTDDEGMESNHWNSELNQDMYVSEGLECEESILNDYPDIITDLLTRMDHTEERMDYVETIATPENMQSYVDDFLTNDTNTQETIRIYTYDYLVDNYPVLEGIVNSFMDDYMNRFETLFYVGPKKPGVRSIWFDTLEEGSISNNQEATAFIVSGTKPTFKSIWFDTNKTEDMLILSSYTGNNDTSIEIEGVEYDIENASVSTETTEEKYNFDII